MERKDRTPAIAAVIAAIIVVVLLIEALFLINDGKAKAGRAATMLLDHMRSLMTLTDEPIEQIVAELPTYDGTGVIAAETNSHTIVAATDPTLVGQAPDALVTEVLSSSGEVPHITDLNGKQVYISVRRSGTTILAVTQSLKVVHGDLFPALAAMGGYLLVVALAVLSVIRRMMSRYVTETLETTTDPLTGFANRKAYEDDLNGEKYPPVPTEPGFTYVAVRVEGLKRVNGEQGREVGDRLLRGAATLVENCMAHYGRVYRVSGDEFVAILILNHDREVTMKEELAASVRLWRKEQPEGVDLAVSYMAHSEQPELTVRELAHIAWERLKDAPDAAEF